MFYACCEHVYLWPHFNEVFTKVKTFFCMFFVKVAFNFNDWFICLYLNQIAKQWYCIAIKCWAFRNNIVNFREMAAISVETGWYAQILSLYCQNFTNTWQKHVGMKMQNECLSCCYESGILKNDCLLMCRFLATKQRILRVVVLKMRAK